MSVLAGLQWLTGAGKAGNPAHYRPRHLRSRSPFEPYKSMV